MEYAVHSSHILSHPCLRRILQILAHEVYRRLKILLLIAIGHEARDLRDQSLT